MSEWWTYSLSDFLMFSARSYYRQFALMNRELWPLHVLALAAGLAILACTLRPRPGAARVGFGLLALAWAWVAWAYLLERHADINTGAPWFAAGFGVQAALLAWMALRKPAAPVTGMPARVAQLVVAAGLAIWPLLAPLDGRGWMQAEVFGLAPDPTAAATLGALLFWRAPWPLWILPLAWCAASSATLHELHVAQAWALPLLALLAAISAWAGAAGRRSSGAQ
ncbi:DUF6064 family protein [Massilia sp. G4R7]|uniref:DUF6064 family protein n=1 Tax=Massilia phyllostachyos TaxID=2898585 RepID=A0ABS8PZA9_9BURK|nr:DUF6064 family protein [Massilia phyllostachyos]MCD2514841.1 DUF6064 family protein [Massilia phyllostachyos]